MKNKEAVVSERTCNDIPIEDKIVTQNKARKKAAITELLINIPEI